MCGIAGVDADDGVDRDALVRMQRCLEHRGPDDSGVYVDGTTGLAHRRLSIVGVDSGQQPITNEDGSVVVVFNGEIYNFPELRQQLRADGHQFETDTDTEVLVHLYEDHGDALVDRIDGMFAFALWDADAERLLLARDRMGIKPLLLATDGRTRAFASELDPLFETDVDLGGIDRTALAAYFALGYVPAPRTVFRNVRKLEPGHLAVVSDGELRTRQFYSPSVRPRDPGFDAACEELAGRVRDAVERRLMADVPLGAFLSGGIDSSIVVALMAELQTDPVETFTVGFERERFDETWAAREVAEYYGTDHHEFTVTVDDLRGTAPELFTRMGEPFADPSLLPTYAVARETGRKVKVALSGDGGDELFAGYRKYQGELLSGYLRRVPRPLRSAIDRGVGSLPSSRDTATGERIRKLKGFLAAGSISDGSTRHFNWNRISDRDIEVDGTSTETTGTATFRRYHDEIGDLLPPERRDALARMQAVDVMYPLPDQILHKVDTASMYNSLEVRTPLLDRSVVEYAMSLPTAYKIDRAEQKRVLKGALGDRLPPAIRRREKSGFDMPLGHWFRNELADEFRELLRQTETDLLDERSIRRTFERHVSGRQAAGKFLWAVYVFCRWYERMQRLDVL